MFKTIFHSATRIIRSAVFVLVVFGALIDANGSETLRSPDGKLRVEITAPGQGNALPHWSASFMGKFCLPIAS